MIRSRRIAILSALALGAAVPAFRRGSSQEPKGRLRDLRTRVEGLRIFARTSQSPAGGGPPVVLVHGYGMSSSYMVPIAERLAAERTVYAPDLPGHGRSDGPGRPLSISGLAESLRAWMDSPASDQ